MSPVSIMKSGVSVSLPKFTSMEISIRRCMV